MPLCHLLRKPDMKPKQPYMPHPEGPDIVPLWNRAEKPYFLQFSGSDSITLGVKIEGIYKNQSYGSEHRNL